MDSTQNKIVIFDSDCVLCNSSVSFIIRNDPKRKFRFSSFQSKTIKQFLNNYNEQPGSPDSLILIAEDRIYLKSTAALKIAKQLNGLWPVFYVLIIIPKPVRDFVYDLVARNRYHFFGKNTNCLIPDEKDLDRFFP